MGTKQEEEFRDHPTYWFTVLHIALDRNDYSRAAEAKRELRRLGIDVRFRRPSPNATEGASV